MASLEPYKKKRNFKKTPEPKAEKKKGHKNPIFVVQKHYASHLHYDFRLEVSGLLKSWAIPKGPPLKKKIKRLAIQTEDHPIGYADFEGEIPEGQYGAGKVEIWDRGTYKTSKDHSIKKGLKEGKIEIELLGEKLRGIYDLIHFKANQWLLIKRD